MDINPLENTQQFIQEYVENGGSESEAHHILSHLMELAVVMYRKGDIKTIQQPQKMELVCQLKKGSRRISLS
jgi:hypothetical protein